MNFMPQPPRDSYALMTTIVHCIALCFNLQLGWSPGIAAVCLAYLAVLWTATVTVRLHEYKGTRHTRYRELGQAIFGKLSVVEGMCICWLPLQQLVLGAYLGSLARLSLWVRCGARHLHLLPAITTTS